MLCFDITVAVKIAVVVCHVFAGLHVSFAFTKNFTASLLVLLLWSLE